MLKKHKIVMLLLGALLYGYSGAAPLAAGAAKFLGNITTNGAVRSDFGTYWNQITAENECKWSSIEGSRGNYNFRGCEAAYNWAKNNNGKFKFHTLIWGGQYPSWLKNLSQEETLKAITAWFDAVKKQFPDLEMIDVVNEAIRTGNNQYHSPFPETKQIAALGGDNNGDYKFVVTAFKMARERWPNAILIYNDYNTFRWQVNEGIDLVNKIKAAGAPVDAYGLQAHDLNGMSVNEFKTTLKKINDQTKLPLFISEYDIGTEDDASQRQHYADQISAFMEAPYVAGITLWGYIYGSTWLTNGNSGIIKNGVDRPAMTWLKQYMATNKGVNTTGLFDGTPPVIIPPEERAPYKGVIAIPGTVEAENYDKGGQNVAYYDNDVENQGGAYRQDQVDVKAVGNGFVVGYTMVGEWLEYTVNVATAGAYTYKATVSSGVDGSSFRLFMDGKAISDTVKVANGGNWDTYSVVAGDITTPLTKGSHVLRIAITGNYVDIDKIEFAEGTIKLGEINMNITQGAQSFDVYSVKGSLLQTYSASSVADLKAQMQSSNMTSGVYLVRNNTGKFMINLNK